MGMTSTDCSQHSAVLGDVRQRRTESAHLHLVSSASSCTCSETKMRYTTIRNAMSRTAVSHKVIT